MKKIVTGLILLALLSACEMPDVKGLNSTPKKMDKLSEQMENMKAKLHDQSLLLAKNKMDEVAAQELLFPVPTAMMVPGQKLAHELTAKEAVELTYITLEEISEVIPAPNGLDKDLQPIPLTETQVNELRLKNLAKFNVLAIVAAFIYDHNDQAEDPSVPDIVSQIIQTYIVGNNRFQKAALSLLALRAYFLREVILSESLKLRVGYPETLANSGYMKEALSYLIKLNDISRLPFADKVSFRIQDKTYSTIDLQDAQDAGGRLATAALWKEALKRAKKGSQEYTQSNWTSDNKQNVEDYNREVSLQNYYLQVIQKYAESWSTANMGLQ